MCHSLETMQDMYNSAQLSLQCLSTPSFLCGHTLSTLSFLASFMHMIIINDYYISMRLIIIIGCIIMQFIVNVQDDILN